MEKIIGRKEFSDLVNDALNLDIKNANILITGANGSIGIKLCQALTKMNVNFNPTDINSLNVLNPDTFPKDNYTHVINLAASKHAPLGETEVEKTFLINTIGTLNLLKAYPKAKHILTSTCKACNPETVYGASKLIAERLVLNANGSVARFYNVVPSVGNVFEIWDKQDTINVAYECNRYFITINEAVALVLFAIIKKGRLMINLDDIRNMSDIANELYPDKSKKYIKPRRGDRINEKKMADHEFIVTKIHKHINLIQSNND